MAQDWCCQSGYHCCPKQTCCLESDNCYTPGYCCPKTAETCGNPDYCLSDDQSCCGDSYCDAGFECMKTPNGTSTCCKSNEQACNGGYCTTFLCPTLVGGQGANAIFRLSNRLHVFWRRDLSRTVLVLVLVLNAIDYTTARSIINWIFYWISSAC